MSGKDKSMDKMNRFVKSEVTAMFERILDYAQIAVPTEAVYKALRSKILRAGNDCIRRIQAHNTKFYDVEYKPVSEDVIKVDKVTN